MNKNVPAFYIKAAGAFIAVFASYFFEFHWVVVIFTAVIAVLFIVLRTCADIPLLAGVFLLPLRISVALFGSECQLYHFFIACVIVAGIAYVADSYIKKSILTANTGWLPALLLIVLMFFSGAFMSRHHPRTFYDIKNLIFLVGFFYLILNTVSHSLRRKLFNIIVFPAVPLALLGISQHWHRYYFVRYTDIEEYRAMGFFDSPNIFALFLVIAIIMTVCLLLSIAREYKSKRIAFGLIILILLYGLAATLSRSGWVCLAAGLIVLAILMARKWLLYSLVGIILVIFVLPGEFHQRLISIVSLKDYSNFTRVQLAYSGIKMFFDHPLLGVGQGNFQYFYENYYKSSNAATNVSLSHIVMVTILAELGIIGFGVFMWLLFKIGRAMWNNYKTLKTGLHDFPLICQAGLIAIGVALFINGQLNGSYWQEPYVWLTLGLGVGKYQKAER